MSDALAMPQDLGWDDNKVIEAGRALRELLGTVEFQSLREVIDAQERLLMDRIAFTSDTTRLTGLAGELRGLRSVTSLAEGVVLQAEELARRYREQTEAEAEEVAA